MKIFCTLSLASILATAQVGIDTETPKATLDVMASPNNPAKPDGIIAPRLTGEQLKANDAVYGAEQIGAIVYATSSAEPTTSKTIKVTDPGYYYFDGAIWQIMDGIEPWHGVDTNKRATENTQDIFQMGKVGVNTTTPQAQVEINGDLIVKETPLLDNTAQSLYVDANGLVGKRNISPNIPPIIAMQTNVSVQNVQNSFNSGNKIIIPLNLSDAVVNTLGASQAANSIRIPSAGYYMVSSSYNVLMSTGAIGDHVYMAVNLEKSSDNGVTWETVSGTRPIITTVSSVDRYYPVVSPTVVLEIGANDRLRAVAFRTRFTNNALSGSPLNSLSFVGPQSQGTKGYTLTLSKL